jgi:hypothetical protein
MLATLLLVALLLLPTIPAETPSLKIDPLVASRVRHRDYTVYVYADYDNSYCPENGSVNKIIGESLDLALQIHKESMLRFVQEYGFEYAKLVLLKFERTSNIDEAAVIVRVKDIEALGQALYTRYSGRYYGLIIYDCDLAEYPLNAVLSTILHELYHTIGLGHPDKDNGYELMGYGLDYFYPSSLDAAAIWELWFSGRYDNYQSDETIWFTTNLSYTLLEPFPSTIDRLLDQNRELLDRNKKLEDRIRGLASENYDLKNDIMTLRDRVTKYEYEVRGLSAENEALRNETARLNMLVGDLSGRLEEREKAVAKLSEELSSASARISSLESQVEKLESLKSSLENENELLRARIDSLRWWLLVLVVTFVCTAVSLAVVWRTRKK